MKNKDIEARLHSELEETMPEVLDDILSRCDERKGTVIEMNKIKAKRNWAKPFCATVAAIALIVCGVLCIGQYQSAHAVEYSIWLDVNPSIELDVNQNDRVTCARALNPDAEDLFEKFEEFEEFESFENLKGLKVNAAVDKIMMKFVKGEYLTTTRNSVLLSVNNPNIEKCKKIQKQLMDNITLCLESKGIDGAVLGQCITSNDELKELSEKHGISEGKALFVSEIINKSAEMGIDEFDELANLPINDLAIIYKKLISNSEEVAVVGTPANGGYVGIDYAIKNTCTHANVIVDDDVFVDAKISLGDNGKLVYDVYVEADGVKVNCNVDAVTGNIIKWACKMIGSESEITPDSGNRWAPTSNAQVGSTENLPITIKPDNDVDIGIGNGSINVDIDDDVDIGVGNDSVNVGIDDDVNVGVGNGSVNVDIDDDVDVGIGNGSVNVDIDDDVDVGVGNGSVNVGIDDDVDIGVGNGSVNINIDDDVDITFGNWHFR